MALEPTFDNPLIGDNGKAWRFNGTTFEAYEPDVVQTDTALPTASASYRGRRMILEASGQPDHEYLCIRLGDGSYDWKETTG